VVLLATVRPYRSGMALVRILIDGYSLLHEWMELAAGEPRHSAAARDALVQTLTHYQDAIATPITIFFDGGGAPVNTPEAHSTRQLEVLYSRKGQTADDMIERAAYRFQDYGEVLAVTNDNAERNIVIHMGGMAESCGNFIHTVEATLAGMAEDVDRHNRQEQVRYRASRNAPTRARSARKP
jgi:predicted RNA-binding protein with PIN domain